MHKTGNPQTIPGTAGVAAEGLSKTFPGGVVALEDASFDVRPGEFAALVGPSGCGKSTLLRLVAGLIDRTGGCLRFRGEEISEPREDIGFMFQKPNLLPWKTTLQNTLLPNDVKRGDRGQAKAKALALLRLVGLAGFEHHYPAHLSGGMQQRVALSRLLMTGAELLLLDEPFGALDEFTRERLNVELMRIHAELQHTTLFVTHNIAEAIFLSDRVIVMSARPGRVVKVLDVPFERSRAIKLQRTPEFNDLVFEIRDILGEQS